MSFNHSDLTKNLSQQSNANLNNHNTKLEKNIAQQETKENYDGISNFHKENNDGKFKINFSENDLKGNINQKQFNGKDILDDDGMVNNRKYFKVVNLKNAEEDPSNLNDLKKNSAGEKLSIKFKLHCCPIPNCNRKFKEKGNLKNHIRAHVSFFLFIKNIDWRKAF